MEAVSVFTGLEATGSEFDPVPLDDGCDKDGLIEDDSAPDFWGGADLAAASAASAASNAAVISAVGCTNPASTSNLYCFKAA